MNIHGNLKLSFSINQLKHLESNLPLGDSYISQSMYVARPQSTFPTRPTASKPYIARSNCAYVIEQCCSMAHALTVLPAFSQ
jgi:hypothetical protein